MMNSQSNQPSSSVNREGHSGFPSPAPAGSQNSQMHSLNSVSSSLAQPQYLLQQPNYLDAFNGIGNVDNTNNHSNAVYQRNTLEKPGSRSAVQQQQLQHQLPSNLAQPSEQTFFLQMQQQYENQIRSLQLELSAFRANQLEASSAGTATRPTTTASALTVSQRKTSTTGAAKRTQSTGIVDTYSENIAAKEFSCKNCSYRTKSEASLVVHNTNHLVNQRYLHLPTTVFSVQPSNHEAGGSPQAFLYPCGECSGKFPQNDLYLHIYQHHTGESPFHCDECDLFFMHFEFLDDHQRSKHYIKVTGKKKSRYNSSQTVAVDSSVDPPALTYYSVVKCSKPFSVLHSLSQSLQSAGGDGTENRVSNIWESQTAEMNSSARSYTTYDSSQHKRGRGRGRGGTASNH